MQDSRRSLQSDSGSAQKKAPLPQVVLGLHHVCSIWGMSTSGVPPQTDTGVNCQGVSEGDLITKEDREEGQIGSKVYLYYARAYGCAAERLIR
jgi:hypothetical protein